MAGRFTARRARGAGAGAGRGRAVAGAATACRWTVFPDAGAEPVAAAARQSAAQRQAARRQGAPAPPADRGDQPVGAGEAAGGRDAARRSSSSSPNTSLVERLALNTAGARRVRRRDPRRDDRARPARAAAQGPDHQRHPDQRPRMRLRRARGMLEPMRRAASRTRRICCASSTRSSSAVGRRVDESQPMCDARLLDGSRVNVAVRPIGVDGPLVSIRKFSKKPFNLNKLVEIGAITPADGRGAGRRRARRASPRSSRAAPAPARPRCSTRSRPSSPRRSA